MAARECREALDCGGLTPLFHFRRGAMNLLRRSRAEVRQRALHARRRSHLSRAQSQSGVEPPQSKGSRHDRRLPGQRWERDESQRDSVIQPRVGEARAYPGSIVKRNFYPNGVVSGARMKADATPLGLVIFADVFPG